MQTCVSFGQSHRTPGKGEACFFLRQGEGDEGDRGDRIATERVRHASPSDRVRLIGVTRVIAVIGVRHASLLDRVR